MPKRPLFYLLLGSRYSFILRVIDLLSIDMGFYIGAILWALRRVLT